MLKDIIDKWDEDRFKPYKDRITELEAGLERYGRHERSCGCHEFELAGRIGLIELHGAEYKCTCGLDALKGGE